MNHASIIFITLLIFFSSGYSQEQESTAYMQFQRFLEKYRKSYETAEELNHRFMIFKQNFDALNLKDSNSEETIFGMTEFFDLTPDEFKRKYLTLNGTELPKDARPVNLTDTTEGRFLSESVPREWDWRKVGAVSPVKNQGNCGACWAFSSIQNIESIYFIKYGKLPILSAQQLVDCSPNDSGCLGGLIHTTYPYIQTYGLYEAKDYPYEAYDGHCRYKKPLVGEARYSISGYVYSGTSDEEKIKIMLYRYGPLAITMNANILQFYVSGVIDVPYNYCPYGPTHGVVIVGYGTTSSGLDYWIIKNTYGPYWGENGYFRIARGKGLCGINQYVVSATLD
jgi:cathepsin F